MTQKTEEAASLGQSMVLSDATFQRLLEQCRCSLQNVSVSRRQLTSPETAGMSDEGSASLCHSFKAIGESLRHRLQTEDDKGMHTATSDKIWQILLLPGLSVILSGEVENDVGKAVIGLMKTIGSLPSGETEKEALDLILKMLKSYNKETDTSMVKSESFTSKQGSMLVEVMRTMLIKQSHLQEDQIVRKTFGDDLFQELMHSLAVADDSFVSNLLTTVVPLTLDSKSEPGDCREKLQQVLKTAKEIFEHYGQKSYVPVTSAYSFLSERPYLILCGIADLVLPASGAGQTTRDLLESPIFWELIQAGLYHASPLTRKRTVYLLKRTLDVVQMQQLDVGAEAASVNDSPCYWWNTKNQSSLAEVWENYILLLETLEEKQV